MTCSLAVAFLMLIGKLTAYFITGSSAILSDAAESIVHIAASGVAAFSLWYSMQAPDKKHPYGHGKIVYFSSGFEGGLIGFAALSILYLAGRDLIFGSELKELGAGIAITAVLSVINCVLGLFLIRVGKRNNSLILEANGKHILTDMWTSAGVVIGVTIVWFTGIVWLDPVVAIIMALNILHTAYSLMNNAFQGLLDEADPQHTQMLLDYLQNLVDNNRISGYHQLRHRQTENTVWIEVHILVPAELSTRKAHTCITEIEKQMMTLLPGHEIHVTTHVEPAEHSTAHPDGHEGPEDPYPPPTTAISGTDSEI